MKSIFSNTSSKRQKTIAAAVLSLQLLVFGSCSTGSTGITVSEGDFETIVIVGTNDIHGALSPLRMKTREADNTPAVEYESGGAVTLASYVRKLRNEFGNNLVWLDGGDEFQGSIESNAAEGAPLVMFFNSTGLNAAAIGNHEFDYGPVNNAPHPQSEDRLGALKARTVEADYPYVSANIVEAKTGKRAPLPNTFPSVMFNVGRLKVGVIGLTTLETPHTTFPENIKTLLFQELEKSAIREAQTLRKSGAHVVLLAAHVGLNCEIGRASPSQSLRKPTDPLGFCGQNDELVQFLKKVPAGTIDAVVSGHSHQVIHHWVEGVPVVQGGSSARYINLIYLTYDLKNGRVAGDRTRIEGPVPVCPLVFENQGDCNGDRPAPKNGRGALVKTRFHGETLSQDDATLQLLKPVFEKSAQIRSQRITQAARPLEHDRRRESDLGNLISDAMRDFSGSDAALMNSGGIRAPIDQGAVLFENVFRTLPFDNTLTVVTVTGKELKNILRAAQSGGRGFHGVSGLKLRLIPLDKEAPSNDLNGNRKIEPWEVNRLLDVRLANGAPVLDEKSYTLAVPDFLALGGDDMKWPMGQVPRSRMKMHDRLVRDIVVDYLKSKTPSPAGWNSVEFPLVDAKSPRFVFGKVATGRAKKKGKKRRR